MDKLGVDFDTAAQAIRMERLEHKNEMISQQVKNSLDAMTSALHNVQIETRSQSVELSKMAQMQASQQHNAESILDMKRQLAEMNDRLKEYFDDFDERHQRRWEAYERNRDEWRREHELQNNTTEEELTREIRSVREVVIRGLGWATGAGGLITLLGAGFIGFLNYRFSESAIAATRLEADSQLRQNAIDKLNEKMHEVELYLARGAVNRTDPYVTEQQRTNNGNRK